MEKLNEYLPHLFIGALIVGIVVVLSRIKQPRSAVIAEMKKRKDKLYRRIEAAETISEINEIEKDMEIFDKLFWGLDEGREESKWLQIAIDEKSHDITNAVMVTILKQKS